MVRIDPPPAALLLFCGAPTQVGHTTGIHNS
jgi:hypothetical protein